MKRKQFIKNAALTAAGSMVVPYILPSGRLFARSGTRRADHVVVCLFAGGVRNTESVQKSEGNLMRNMLNGTESISSDIAPGVTMLPTLASSPLQNAGTLFKEFRYASGPTGHYNAHAAAITGVYSDQSIQLKQPPPFPTVFEYYRKHNSPANNALNAWWVSNSLGPYPYLNYSTYDGYGAAYGANMIQPYSFFSQSAVLGNPATFSSAEKAKCDMMRDFANGQFKIPPQAVSSGMVNSPADAEQLQLFLNDMMAQLPTIQDPWGIGASMTGDMKNIYLGIEILKRFKPELTVINMTDIDIGHFDYTKYVNAIGLADYALYKLWDAIQTPGSGMENNTVLIVVPEHGRNQLPNTVVDAYGRKALDHNNDEMSRHIFCMMAGKGIKQGQVFSGPNPQGETIDVVPTVANILGFDTDITSGVLSGRVLTEAYT